MKTYNGGWFLRLSNDELIFKENFEKPEENCQYLAKLILDNGNFKIVGLDYYSSLPKNELLNFVSQKETQLVNQVNEENLEKCWLVVRSLKSKSVEQGYKLCIGDILKLGRVKFKIKEVRKDEKIETLNDINKEDEKTNEVEAEVCEYLDIDENGEFVSDFTCRICLCETFTHDNPLVNICSCSGTVK